MSLSGYEYGAPVAARPGYNSQAALQTRTSVPIWSKLICIVSAMAPQPVFVLGTQPSSMAIHSEISIPDKRAASSRDRPPHLDAEKQLHRRRRASGLAYYSLAGCGEPDLRSRSTFTI